MSKNYFNPFRREEGLKIRGFVELLVHQKGKLVDRITDRNIILNQGKAETIMAYATGSSRIFARMAIGDRGALPSNPLIPRVPEASRTGLFSEVYRQDVEVTSTTTEGSTNRILLVTTFRALDVPTSAFTDLTNPVINELGLVMVNLTTGNPLPRTPIASPNAPDADEAIFAMRTFRTVPFEASNETAVTARYTISIN